MKNRRLHTFIVCFVMMIFLCGCTKKSNSTFNIRFIDVGQGDSALVECDGHYMLIDGGDKSHGDKVYRTLQDENVNHLDILVVSHIHDDHIGGLPKALTWASTVDLALCAVDETNSDELFQSFVSRLVENGGKLTKPSVGQEYKLGSATVKILDYGTTWNESMVLLVTYGNTSFLFTGDMEHDMENRMCGQYNDELTVTLLKVSHHGADSSTSIRFLDMLTDPKRKMKQYAVISVGQNNRYGHPDQVVLDRLDQAGFEVYRTDKNGDIFVQSNGKNLKIKTGK